jgi:hypothetical protein
MWGNIGFGGRFGGFNAGFGGYGGGYQMNNMPGYNYVDYSGGWNPSVHDQMLINNIERVYQQYDFNRNGQLEGQEFFYAYRDLCLMMGISPPNSYQDVWNAIRAGDANMDGRISRMEMFMLFKRILGINSGIMRPQIYGWY